MVVKAVELVRKIRDTHYEETKNLSPADQIKFFNKKAEELRKSLRPSTPQPDNREVG